MRSIFFLIAFLLVAVGNSWAQQDALIQQYIYNMQLVNPAYVGSREALTITGLGRFQWAGFEGAPITQTLTLHSPLRRGRFGLGFSFLNDQVAEVSTFSGQLDMSVRFKISKTGVFAFGLKGSLWRYNAQLAQLNFQNPGDELLQGNFQSQILPNVGVGGYLKNNHGYLGFSVPALLEIDADSNVVTGGLTTASFRHFYGIAGYAFPMADRVILKASTLLRYVRQAPMQIGVAGRVVFNERLMVGLTYNYQASIGLLMGVNLTPQLQLGYSFDYTTFNLRIRAFNNSHEIALRYDFRYKDAKGTVSPIYF